MYLVTGGTGNAGSAVVRALLAAGLPARVLVRQGREAAVPAGAEPVPGDLNRPETVAAALTGVHGVFLLSGYQRLGGPACVGPRGGRSPRRAAVQQRRAER